MTLGSLSVHFASEEEADALRRDADVRVVEIAGGPSLFGELSLALEFPDYFGHNWDALDECLRDLDTETPLALLVRNASSRWNRAPEEMTALVDVWVSAAEDHHGRLHLIFVW